MLVSGPDAHVDRDATAGDTPIATAADRASETEVPPLVVFPNRRGIVTMRGRAVQRYSPDGHTLIKTYKKVNEATADKQLQPMSISGLKIAIEKRILYRGFRWWFVPPRTPEHTVFDIGPTVPHKSHHERPVAMLSEDEARIEQVLVSMSSLATSLGFTGPAAVVRAVKDGRAIRGRKYVTLDRCEDSMIERFRADGGVIPHGRPNRSILVVESLHPITRAVTATYNDITEVMAKQRCAQKTIKKAIDEGLEFRGALWRMTQKTPDLFNRGV